MFSISSSDYSKTVCVLHIIKLKELSFEEKNFYEEKCTNS